MNEKPKHRKKDRKDFAFGISFTEFMTSAAVGVGSGLVTAAAKVRDLFYDDAKEATAFNNHFHGSEPHAGGEIGQRTLGRAERLDSISLKEMLAQGKKPSDYRHAISEEKRKIANEFDQLALEFRSVSKGPIKGAIERYELLSPRAKGSLFFTGAVGAAIGAAMTLGFFNGVATRDKIERIEDAVGADPAQQQGR